MRKELCDILTKNRPQLVEEIDPENGILNDLTALNVLTRRQAMSIEVLGNPFSQVESLLDMLRRRPDEDFDTFCQVLCKHGQEEVVNCYLKPGSSGEAENITCASERKQDSAQNQVLSEVNWVSHSEASVIPTPEIRVQSTSLKFYNEHKDQAYCMCNAHRGKCYIFNVDIVHGMSRRQGSEEDLRNLKELFRQLHFSTTTFTNPTAKDIIEQIDHISRDPGLNLDQCVVFFFLSHGRIVTTMTKHGHAAVEYIYGSDGEPVDTEHILRPLTNAQCHSLRGKPKLVFFQACREYSSAGYQESSTTVSDANPGTPDASSSSSSAAAATAPPIDPALPSTSALTADSSQDPTSLKDFIIGYSTESGHPSFRDTLGGSWYINAIVKVFSQSAHNMDVCAMLRKVNGMITEWKPVGQLASHWNHTQGQVSSHVDSLTKSYLFFFPGITTGST